MTIINRSSAISSSLNEISPNILTIVNSTQVSANITNNIQDRKPLKDITNLIHIYRKTSSNITNFQTQRFAFQENIPL